MTPPKRRCFHPCDLGTDSKEDGRHVSALLAQLCRPGSSARGEAPARPLGRGGRSRSPRASPRWRGTTITNLSRSGERRRARAWLSPDHALEGRGILGRDRGARRGLGDRLCCGRRGARPTIAEVFGPVSSVGANAKKFPRGFRTFRRLIENANRSSSRARPWQIGRSPNRLGQCSNHPSRLGRAEAASQIRPPRELQ